MKVTVMSFFIMMMGMIWLSPIQSELMAEKGSSASLILHNGKVFTGNPSEKWAEAVVLHDRLVVYVGNNARAMQFATPNTEIIDLKGNLVIPGINDAHVHILPFNPNGPMLIGQEAMLGHGPTLDQLIEAIQQATYIYPTGTWLYASIGDIVYDDPQVTRYLLDEIAPNHPVVLPYMHSFIVNSLALQTVGISETESDCFGGVYERYPGTNILNGRMDEYAEYDFIRRITMNLPVDQLRQLYENYMNSAISLGVTSLQDIPVGLSNEKAIEVLKGIDLKLRIRLINTPMIRDDIADWTPRKQTEPYWSLLTNSGVKWFNDGTVLERNGAVTIPYSDRPDWYGLFNFPMEIYQLMVAEGLKSPLAIQQRLFHTFGDRAVDNLLEAMSNAGPDKKWKKHRLQLIHGDMIRPEHIPLIKSKGIVVVQNPTHLALPQLMLERYGPERMAELQPLKSLLEEGIPLALGTDGIGDIISPFVDIMMAVIHPTRPEEALSVEQAVIAYTSGSAYAEFKENVKGILKQGMLADLTVLSQDIFSIPPDHILATYSLLTIVDGKKVYEAGVL